MKIAVDEAGKQLGFIEYVPSEQAWRPVKAKRWMFIQCIGVFVTGARKQGIGGKLLEECEADARKLGMHGICAMSSEGPWMANRNLFLKNGFDAVGQLERFELLVKPFDLAAPPPRLIDWTKERAGYHGWHLIYADQCPWHAKSVRDITQAAHEHGIALAVRRLVNPKEAQRSPSGFGTFSLIRDGRLLADHYISRTRFENILRVEQRRRE